MKNPLLEVWSKPYDIPDFNRLKPSHFPEAIMEAISLTSKEIEDIANNDSPPTFGNTILALERSGEMVGRLSLLLFNLNAAETNSEIQNAAREVSPALTRLSNDITLNSKLFRRVEQVYDQMISDGAEGEDMMLAETKMRSFIKGGASLTEDKRGRFREISERLSTLSLLFEENLLSETNSFFLHLINPEDIKGIPASFTEMAREEAVSRDLDGWVFTLQAPSFIPFMQYADSRELRKKMFKAYMSRATAGKHDNHDIIREITSLKLEKAKLLGFKNYAEYALKDKMAEIPSNVSDFLNELSVKSHPYAIADYRRIAEYAMTLDHPGLIERWDWSYYSEKLKKNLFNVDDESFRPYFELTKALAAVWSLASDLYGITFRKYDSEKLYHEEVTGWEVVDSNGDVLALLLTDFHPRKGKNGGAWMTNYREQKMTDGVNIRPVVSIVTNFPRATAKRPSLLSFNELTTLLHEFGHALHSIFSQCHYESLSGTNVARDFVELPSQFMENFALEMGWLGKWATHFETGSPIPEELVQRIKSLSTFNEGYACDRQLSFGFLDMAYHTIETDISESIEEFEQKTTGSLDLFPPVENICFSCSFAHIFAGGYSAGYYGYKWAEVLDADAFSLFAEEGVLDRQTGIRFRKSVLEKGGSVKPMDLYISFRGQKPSMEAFLKRSGFTGVNNS